MLLLLLLLLLLCLAEETDKAAGRSTRLAERELPWLDDRWCC
jgi:hypothetical protein